MPNTGIKKKLCKIAFYILDSWFNSKVLIILNTGVNYTIFAYILRLGLTIWPVKETSYVWTHQQSVAQQM